MRIKRKLLRFHVVDWSMAPTLVPGDRLVVDPEAFVGRKPAKGDLIVFWDPEVEGRKLLKRIDRVSENSLGLQVFVVGDNELRSRDSRQFGTVTLDRVIGLVVLDK